MRRLSRRELESAFRTALVERGHALARLRDVQADRDRHLHAVEAAAALADRWCRHDTSHPYGAALRRAIRDANDDGRNRA